MPKLKQVVSLTSCRISASARPAKLVLIINRPYLRIINPRVFSREDQLDR